MVKTSCPVCHKEFKRVAIHIGKSKDQFHKDYKAKQKQEQEQVEQVVDHLIQAIDSAN
jgi:mRNA-degrading endonuclease YafQ of YafQ-DinJ toxin-antitoxin module